jgi:hypothetical protein
MVVLQGGVDAAAETCGEGLIVDEEFFLGWMMEGLVFGVEGNAGNDEMDVGMVLDLAAPDVQEAGEAKAGSEVFGGGDVLKGGGALAQDERIEDLGVVRFSITGVSHKAVGRQPAPASAYRPA